MRLNKKKTRAKNYETIVMADHYHTLKKEQEYVVVKEGIDWYCVRNKGKLIYVFKSLVL